jgi:hypothetical protein
VQEGKAVVDWMAVNAARGAPAAHTAGAFEHERRDAVAMEGARQRQSRHAATDNDDVVGHVRDGRANGPV